MAEHVRIDKWLWAVRIFKTRSQATEACKKGRVTIGDLPVKASREVHPGEVVKVRKPPFTRSFKVLGLAEKRMGAKLAGDFVEDVTLEPARKGCRQAHKKRTPQTRRLFRFIGTFDCSLIPCTRWNVELKYNYAHAGCQREKKRKHCRIHIVSLSGGRPNQGFSS